MSNEKMSISYACLQSTIFVPNGPGQFGPTLTTSAVGNKRIASMTLDADFLTLDMVVDGKATKVMIPNTMVSHAVVTRTLAVVPRTE